MILHYFNKKENKERNIAEDIYKSILIDSGKFLKTNNFFVDKNYNTSFEIVSIFLIINIRVNIDKKTKNFKKINEFLMEIFISDIDESLRTKGIGDMSIGKYVKKYVKKFYFRLSKFPKKISFAEENFLEPYLNLLIFTKKNEIKNASIKFFQYYKHIYNYSDEKS